MKLIKCGHCGRPYYDKEKACPYCGHAFDSLPEIETKDEELETVNTVAASNGSPLSVLSSPFTTRAQSIAAITETNSQLTNPDNQDASDCSTLSAPHSPFTIETTYPPRHRHTALWVIIILFLLAAIAATAYLFRDQIKQLF